MNENSPLTKWLLKTNIGKRQPVVQNILREPDGSFYLKLLTGERRKITDPDAILRLEAEYQEKYGKQAEVE